MAWKNIKTTSYTGYLDGSTQCSGFIKFTLQYDDTSITPTSIKLRFYGENTGTYEWKSDDYYVYWAAKQQNKEKLICIKKENVDWPYTSSTFTITKDAMDSGFSIADYWICHTGDLCNAGTLSTSDGYLYITYGDSGKRKASWYFENNRKNFKTIVSGYNANATYIPTIKVASSNGAGGAISVVDNGNNTVTINVPAFIIGNYNSISPDPNNGYESNYVYIRFHTASGNINKLKSNTGKYTLDLEPDTYEISVWAKVCSKYGSDIEKKLLNISVKYYTPPKAPTKMWINTAKKSQYPDNVKSSYKSSGTSSMAENDAIKPRLKNLLMWKWSGYSGGTNAPVAGFRVFIFKNSTTCLASNSVKVTDLYGINTTTEGTKSLVNIGSTEVGNNSLGDYYDIGVDLDNEIDTQFGFIPIDNGFTKKDTCTCKVYTYSYWGDKDSSGNKKKHFSDAAFDGELDYLTGSCTLFSSAVVHVKTTNGWVEGTPYVKTAANTWVEADSVYVKTATNTWTEST